MKTPQEKFSKEMGKRIGRAQAQSKVDDHALVEYLGCSLNELRMYRNGFRSPGSYRLALIARKLSVSTDYLTCLED